MNTFGITEKSYQLLLDTFLKHQEIEQVILFGSRAKGIHKKGSDIDLAIKANTSQPYFIFNLKAYLNEALPIPYFIDLVDYNSLDYPELKEHIDRVGIPFYQKEAFSKL